MGRFVPSPNFDAAVAEAVEPDLVKKAERIAGKAATNANRDTGYYNRSLRATIDDRGVVAETMDPFGHLIEWGSINNTPQAPLRRAASDEGRFKPT